jgi:hypothetical protein
MVHRFIERGASFLAALALASGLLAAGAGFAKDEGVQHKPVVDTRADFLLRAMSDYLSGAESFTVRAKINFDDVLPSGQKIQLGAVQDIAVRRPDRVYTEYDGDAGAKRFWYDGKSITMYDAAADVYATAPMPAKIDAALDQLMKKYDFSPPLSDLLYSDPYATLKPYADFGAYLGERTVDGTRCHHLAFVAPNIDWQIWIEDGTEVVPCKMVITYKNLPGAPQFEATFSDWDFGARLIDAQFAPKVPPGTAKIDFLPSAVTPAGAAKMETAPKEGKK